MIEEVGLLYQGLKDAAGIVKTVDTAEAKLDLYGKLLDLSSKSQTLQEKMIAMLDENKKLKQQIEELQKIKITEEDIEYHEDAFVTLKRDSLKRKFCQKCWEKERKLYQLQAKYVFSDVPSYYKCTECETTISDRNEKSK